MHVVAGIGHEDASQDRGDHLREREGKELDARLDGGGGVNGLEVEGDIIEFLGIMLVLFCLSSCSRRQYTAFGARDSQRS